MKVLMLVVVAALVLVTAVATTALVVNIGGSGVPSHPNSLAGLGPSSGSSASPSPDQSSPTASLPPGVVLSTPSPIPTDTPLPTPTDIPTDTSSPGATPTPTAPPTPPPPTPTPDPYCGAPQNPWGYNFCGGPVITAAPGGFCGYFSCANPTQFYRNARGYIVECGDGTYAWSRGSYTCSSGILRTLYA